MSNRLNKRASYELLERKLRSLERRETELTRERFFYIPLEKPLFQGYKMLFVFRKDVTLRSDFSTLEKLLPLINRTLYSKTKDFIKTKRKRRKRYKAPMPHDPVDIQQHQWDKLTLKEKSYFIRIEHFNCGRLTILYRWNYRWMLSSKIEKHFITKMRVENLDVQSELKEIKNFIVRRGLKEKTEKLVYNYVYRSYDSNDCIDKIEKFISKETKIYLSFQNEQ